MDEGPQETTPKQRSALERVGLWFLVAGTAWGVFLLLQGGRVVFQLFGIDALAWWPTVATSVWVALLVTGITLHALGVRRRRALSRRT